LEVLALPRRYRRIAAVTTDLRQAPGNAELPEPTEQAVEPAIEIQSAEEVSYRDLQEQAKAAGVSAKGSREELEARIAEANGG
jgi:hypothetical protein